MELTWARTVVSGSALVLALAGCGAADAAAPEGTVHVLASFYPLQYVAEQVGGDRVTVTSLTPPGAEPHDVELSPRQVREVGAADVVVTLSGFQPAVDEAVAARSPEHLVDAAAVPAVAEHLHPGHADDDEAVDAGSASDEHVSEGDDDHAAEGHTHAEDHDAEGHTHGGDDPHFWLDPTLLAAVATEVADALAAADPDRAAEYADRADVLVADLVELDALFVQGLRHCERRTVLASHAAFGFLAERYGLEQVGVSGIEPDAEPSPARLREVRDVVVEHGVTTVFTEPLVDPSAAETIAADLGLRTAVLDPVESRAEDVTDYRGAMERNLAALRDALGCR